MMQIRQCISTLGRVLALTALLPLAMSAQAQTDPLPSWNEGATKQAIVDFVKATTTQGGPQFVPPAERIATFDNDGTLWVEHPMYSQVMYILQSVPALIKAKPELAKEAPFSTVMEVLKGDHTAMKKITTADLYKLLIATSTGMSEEAYSEAAKKWIAAARDPRWKRPFTDLTYLPMQEVLSYLRDNGYKTYIVTGGGQDFVRTFAEQTYGVPPEQVIGTTFETRYTYAADGKPVLMKEPKLQLDNDKAGKAKDISLMIGRRPYAAFGNSDGDKEMLEYTKAGEGARLSVLLLHDDAEREYAYGPANGQPATKIGEFTQALYDQASKQGWTVISMKNDWKQVFSFEP